MSEEKLQYLYIYLVQNIINDEELQELTVKSLRNFLLHTTNAISEVYGEEELSEEEMTLLAAKNIL